VVVIEASDGEGDAGCGEPGPERLELLSPRGTIAELFDDGEKVGYRADRTEWNGAEGTEGATGRGDDEGGLDGVEGDATCGEGAGEKSIVTRVAARSVGQGVVGDQQGPDIVV
jgi:hypothetical protein